MNFCNQLHKHLQSGPDSKSNNLDLPCEGQMVSHQVASSENQLCRHYEGELQDCPESCIWTAADKAAQQCQSGSRAAIFEVLYTPDTLKGLLEGLLDRQLNAGWHLENDSSGADGVERGGFLVSG